MKIKRLELQNFRSASKIAFDFTSQLNLFVGVNGSGKSTVLDALSICLSWLVKRIEQENVWGSDIPVSSLRNNQIQGYLNIHVTEKNTSYRWLVTKTKGRTFNPESQLGSLDKLAQAIKTPHEQDISLPVIVYYPVNRTVETVRPEIPNRNTIYNLDGYENSLSGKADYQSFFEWFRVQDDKKKKKAM
ncbi:MAG: AAA family ATPase, partial [Desulfobacteraceae bacterium]|nr:AAA family ATPase [Desulfobacteraceae bacterium]